MSRLTGPAEFKPGTNKAPSPPEVSRHHDGEAVTRDDADVVQDARTSPIGQ